MQIKHESNILGSTNTLNKITSMCWSPNGSRLAVVNRERFVQLFDENCQNRDNFTLKPAPNLPKTFIVKQMCFSPDSSMIAFAQSDNVVYVYKVLIFIFINRLAWNGEIRNLYVVDC